MKKFLAALLALLLTAGCASVPLPNPLLHHVSKRAIVWSVFADFGAYAATGANNAAIDRPTDNTYFFPSRLQLAEMDKAVNAKLHTVYLAEAWDCDDIAWEWRVLCHRWSVENVSKDYPIAVFVCYADVDENAFDGRLGFSGSHAMGLLCDISGVWWYVEPRLHLKVKVEEAKFEGSIRCRKIVW